MADHIAARFRADIPKRILALDGGGTRGIVSLCFLERIEATLRKRFDDDQLVLADYFDLIGGTSVGSMIATLLAAGKDVAYVRALFESWAPRIFDPDSMGVISHMYDARILRGLVQTEVLDWTLGSEKLRTGLCIVAKRADTGSVWAIVNNPAGPYFNPRPPKGNGPARIGNRDYKLLDLIRASTAAPRYFSSASIGIFDGIGEDGLPGKGRFIDGCVSPHANPALLLLMMAGVSGYNFGGGEIEPRGNRRPWRLGEDNVLVISVGTGTYDHEADSSSIAALDAAYALQGMVSDGQQLALAMLQWMSAPNRSWYIDRGFGTLEHDLLGDHMGIRQPLLSFQRYDVRLDDEWLKDAKTCGVAPGLTLDALRDFTNPDAIPHLAAIAERAARLQVADADFPAAFDRIWKGTSDGGG